MIKNYKNKMQEEKEIKSKVENIFFFPPQDGYPEFSCQALSLEEAEEKYREFKKNKK
jgi:hypothetical protein